MKSSSQRFGSIRKGCEVCGDEFRTSPVRHKAGHARFCSLECTTKARRSGLIRSKFVGPGAKFKAYSPEEDAFLRKHYQVRTPKWIGEQVGRTPNSVKRRAQRLGLAKVQQRVRRWTQEEEDWLRDNYSRLPLKKLAKELGRSVNAIRVRAKRLGARRMVSDWLSASEVAAVFGVDRGTPTHWIQKGWLKARKAEHRGSAGTWEVRVKDVRSFVLDYPGLIDIGKVDKLSFIDIVSGRAM